MLIEFSIENFRSIRERITLSLVSSSDKSLDYNLIKKEDTSEKDCFLRSEVIYGANASGKSNIVSAFKFLKELVENSHNNQKDTKIKISPFKLDANYSSKPSKFEVVFIKKNTKYVYGVSVTNEKIIDEYLYHYPKGSRALLFMRSNTIDYKFTVDKYDQEFFSRKTLENVLYLSRSTQLAYKKTSEAFDWFKDKLNVITSQDLIPSTKFTIEMIDKDKNLKKNVLNALIEADLGIDDLSLIPVFDNSGNLMNHDVRTIHTAFRGKNNEFKVPFEFHEESDGTQKMFALIGPWIEALSNGHTLIVDELDTKLHHFLNVFLIKLFHDPTQNKNNAQLIFTTHNTNLLNLDLFRRDQIWFTEKNPDTGSTDLYSLLEFSPRKDKNIQKGYLAGRYGAIPFISEDRIF